MGRSSRTADKEKSRIENGRERTRLYRRNFSGKKKCEVLEKDALRKRNRRKETVLSEEEKRNISGKGWVDFGLYSQLWPKIGL